MLKRGGILSAADQRYDLQFVIVDQRGLIERLAPHDNRIAFDCDTALVKVEHRQEPGYRQTVAVFGPLAIYLDPHRAIMRPEPQRVKVPCAVVRVNLRRHGHGMVTKDSKVTDCDLESTPIPVSLNYCRRASDWLDCLYGLTEP